MTAVALAAFDGDDEPLPVVPPVDDAMLDELWRALDRWLIWNWYRREGER